MVYLEVASISFVGSCSDNYMIMERYLDDIPGDYGQVLTTTGSHVHRYMTDLEHVLSLSFLDVRAPFWMYQYKEIELQLLIITLNDPSFHHCQIY